MGVGAVLAHRLAEWLLPDGTIVPIFLFTNSPSPIFVRWWSLIGNGCATSWFNQLPMPLPSNSLKSLHQCICVCVWWEGLGPCLRARGSVQHKQNGGDKLSFQ